MVQIFEVSVRIKEEARLTLHNTNKLLLWRHFTSPTIQLQSMVSVALDLIYLGSDKQNQTDSYENNSF